MGRDGEAGTWDRGAMPASAKSYYYRVLQVAHQQGGRRNLREMLTLCTVLDHLAKKRYGAAGDVLSQRLKAVEAAMVENGWDRAQYLELVDPEGPLLAERAEQHMTARECDFANRLKGKGGWTSSAQSSYGGGGASQKGQEKGMGKAKGKGKAKKGSSQAAPGPEAARPP